VIASGLLAFSLILFPAQIPDDIRPVQTVEVATVPSLESILRSVGFEGRGLSIAIGIARAESSGNTRAYNGNSGTGDKSYGLFQINMLGAMGPERRREYGLSSNEDLFDPYVNARVAYEMSNGGRNWRPWSTYNDGSYLQYAGQNIDVFVGNTGAGTVNDTSESGAAGMFGGGGSGGGGSGANKDYNLPTIKPVSRNEAAEQYGYVEALADHIPDVKKLLDKAVAEGWTTAKFQAEIRDTQWFKTTSEAERKFLVTQYGDPATAGQMWHTAQIKVQQVAAAAGAYIEWDTINNFAYGIMAKGWTDEQLRQELSSYIAVGRDHIGGLAGETIQKLKQYGYQMGVTIDDEWAQGIARGVVGNTYTLEDGMAIIRQQSKGIFTNWKDQIDAGQTVQDLASPYMKSMVNLLELPPGSVDLKDPTIQKALQSKDPQTGANVVKPIWQFENELRNDDRWKQTKNAQDSVMQVAHQVLSDFGVKY